MNDAAEQLGVEPSEPTAALKKALKNRVDAAVDAGRLTEAEGQAMKARIDAGEVPLVGVGPGPGHATGPTACSAGSTPPPTTWGDRGALRTALDDGKTLAQVAKSKGKSVDGLVNALVADAKARLADAVKDGRLTQAQSKAMQSDLEARIAEQVRSTRPAGPMHGPARASSRRPTPSSRRAPR